MSPPADLFGDTPAAIVPARATPAPDRDIGRLPRPATDSPLRLTPPANVYLGTSSWSFPGWRMVWEGRHSPGTLSRQGLPAYAALGLFRTVGIDRSFYGPLSSEQYAEYRAQVPDTFRFLVKAPGLVTDAVTRGEDGRGLAPNRCFLDVDLAVERFVEPAMQGLGETAGPLVFQFSPVPRAMLEDPARWVEALQAFLAALPREVAGRRPLYAVELRNPEFLTPRLMRALRDTGTRYVIGLHDRMPPAERQAAALRVLDGGSGEGWEPAGPLIVRWNLRPGFQYEQAKERYEPFDRLVDEDPATRHLLARLVAVTVRAGQPAFVIANNKAEGSSPLTILKIHETLAGMLGAPGPAM